MKPDYGVIVGRFQVNDLHDGHKELFRQVKARHSAVIVFIGVNGAGYLNQNNPLDFPTRRAMIQAKYDFTVLPLKDRRTDEEWSRELDNAIADVTTGAASVTLYGGRKSFVPHYHGRYAPVELALPIETQKVSGTDIRDAISNQVIESPEFRAGMIYAAAHRWPEALPCVDIAILNDDETQVLLAQKPEETGLGLWRFVGGHYERHKHANWEAAAREEAMEETGLDLITLEQVAGGIPIRDWRYSEPDGIVTTLFKGRAMTSLAKARDDVAKVQWFTIANLTESYFIPEHRVLFGYLISEPKKKAKGKS